MPRWLRIALLGVLLLTIVDGAYLVAVSSHSADSLVHEKHEANDQQEGFNGPIAIVLCNIAARIEAIVVEHKEFLLVLSGVSVAVFTFTLYRATVGLVEMAKVQASAMSKSLLIADRNARAAQVAADAAQLTAETMRDTAQKQLRAYVGIESAEFRIRRSPTNEIKILGKIKITNSGQTPAHNVRLAFHCEVMDIQVGHFPIEFRTEQTYLMPRLSWDAQQINMRDEPVIVESMLAEFVKRRRFLIIWGEVAYEDMDQVPRVSRFKFRQGMLIQNSAGQIQYWHGAPCEDGNKAT